VEQSPASKPATDSERKGVMQESGVGERSQVEGREGQQSVRHSLTEQGGDESGQECAMLLSRKARKERKTQSAGKNVDLGARGLSGDELGRLFSGQGVERGAQKQAERGGEKMAAG
jgi:hypothetical protein